jgi:predicted nucleic acid-binding protein
MWTQKFAPRGTLGKTMGKLRFVLDSCVIIKHLNHELDLSNFFDSQPECEKCVSVITFIEVLADPDITEDEENTARDFLSGCDFMDITPYIMEKAILVRRFKKTLRLPDAVIAATAMELNATLLSTDGHFKDFAWPGFVLQSII